MIKGGSAGLSEFAARQRPLLFHTSDCEEKQTDCNVRFPPKADIGE
jgi:hypothetical protein